MPNEGSPRIAYSDSPTYFADPYKICNQCRGWIKGVVGGPGPGKLIPCGHSMGYTDICPSWSPVDGCQCQEHLGRIAHGQPL